MTDDYFSDRELGGRPRDSEELSEIAWGGVVAIVRALVSSGAFGAEFPEECPDGSGPVGSNENNLSLAIRAEIPAVSWPLDESAPPSTLPVLDLIEFCHRIVAEPIHVNYHKFFMHYHLEFVRESGKREFRTKINRIFSRNGLAFQLTESGRVERLAPAALREALATAAFRTGDHNLDILLESARAKFLSPDPVVRRDALEKLWDAWERLKTLEPGQDKKDSISTLLDDAASEPNWRGRLEREAKELTSIGNSFNIRHSETTQTPLRADRDVDYLFHRLFALIQLLLRARQQ